MYTKYSQMVFCDFDGTITVNETFRKVLQQFVPRIAAQVVPQIDAGTTTLREGVGTLIGALRCDQRQAIIDYVRPEPIRPGFAELVDFLRARGIPLVVVSSGLKFYIEVLLAPWRERIHAVHALEVDCDGDNMQLHLDHDHPREAMPKEWILRRYDTACRIAVGDAVSDFEMVKAADQVFARDRLLQYLRQQQRPVAPFEDFYDIIRALEQTEEHRVG